jgi:hypothetical protein
MEVNSQKMTSLLEFYGLSHEQFKQLFPGYFESHEKLPDPEPDDESEELSS